MQSLTKQQAAVLTFLRAFRMGCGYSPTYRQIAEHFGWSGPSAAKTHVLALQRKGAVRIAAGISRGIVPVEG